MDKHFDDDDENDDDFHTGNAEENSSYDEHSDLSIGHTLNESFDDDEINIDDNFDTVHAGEDDSFDEIYSFVDQGMHMVIF